MVMVVSCESVFECGWLCVEPSSRSTEVRCILAIAATTTAWAVVVPAVESTAISLAGVGDIDAIGFEWEARESASAWGGTAKSPPCRALATVAGTVSAGASSRVSAALNGGGGAMRLLSSAISTRG